MKKKGRVSSFGVILSAVLAGAILFIGASALMNRQTYLKEAAITPTPSVTPRTVRITEDPSGPTSTPTARLLQLNSAGTQVREMQLRLQELGYYNGEADGQYGSGTRQAVEAFQRQNGLDPDGIAGEATLSRLESPDAAVFAATPVPTSTPEAALLQSGSKGDQVKQLQQRLQELGYYNGKIDGDFGKGTRDAVRLFQQQHDLDPDGIAGSRTLKMLYSENAHTVQITPTPESVAVMSGTLPLLVNKTHPVGADFVPADLEDLSTLCDPSLVRIKYSGTLAVREAANALIKMLEAAEKDGITNWQVSAAYRSYADQQSIFDASVDNYMKNNGLSRSKAISATRLTVADPGASEHHTGLAFDMTVPGTPTFSGTQQCKWLHEHCWDYGFIVRYTKEKEDITGFLAEAWHIRYVGSHHSKSMHESGLCLEEYIELANQ